jgi:N6-adenosine-specific RNA methylase IME4
MKQEDAEEYTQALGQVVAGGWRQIALGKKLGVPKALGLSVQDWVQQRLGGYIKLSISERRQAALELKAEGFSQRESAELLGVDEGTIRGDLGKRNAENSAAALQKATPIEESEIVSAENSAADPIDTIAAISATEESLREHAVKEARQRREEEREKRRQENAEKIRNVSDAKELLKHGRFSTVVIDPPWDLGDEGDVNQMGRAKQDYTSIPIDELLLLPIDQISDKDSHLYLWITNRSLPKGFRLIEAWGFRYVTALTWVKPSFGMGNYFRGQTEHVLFAVRGSLPLKRKDAPTVFHADRGPGGHSSKPDEFYEIVESCSPGPYLDFYGRRRRPNWTVFGEDGVS